MRFIVCDSYDEMSRRGAHVTALTEDTIRANSRFFAFADEVPATLLELHPDVVVIYDKEAYNG